MVNTLFFTMSGTQTPLGIRETRNRSLSPLINEEFHLFVIHPHDLKVSGQYSRIFGASSGSCIDAMQSVRTLS